MSSYQNAEEVRGIIKEEDRSKKSSVRGKSIFVGSFILLSLLFLIATVTNPSPSSFGLFTSTSSSVDYSISSSSPKYGASKLKDYVPWDLVVEPYQDQTIQLDSLVIDGVDVTDFMSKYDISWAINNDVYYGATVTVNIAAVGVFDSTLSISKDGSTVFSASIIVAVKYVRREMSSLTTEDRALFSNTLRKLYDLSLEEGQSLYGSNFLNAEWFVYQHLNGAGRTDCDHWHDGAAIVTIHLALTMLAEKSLQSIEPSLSMPYWEYARDYLLYDDWSDATIFSEDLLGVASPLSADHSLTTGVFANISAPSGTPYTSWDIKAEGSLNPFVNAYGYLRSPWNNNPSKYISRYDHVYGTQTVSIPTCDEISKCYQSDTLAKMNDCLNGMTHGTVHIQIGGCWGEGDTMEGVEFLQGMNKLLYFKMLWRMGYTRCPTSCDADSPSTCLCSIPDEYYDTIGAKAMLVNSGVYDDISDHVEGKSDDYLIAVLKGLQDPAYVGEMYSSAASYDPTFWPLHGQLDRLLSLKLIQLEKGNVEFDTAWGFNTNNGRYTVGRCDWSNVQDVTDLTLPVCEMGTEVECPGHGEFDDHPFVDQFTSYGIATNAEMLEFLHPWNDDLPYTYDTFDFDYCVDEGYTF